MKKTLLSLFAIAALAMAFVSCDNGSSSSAAADDTEDTSIDPIQQVYLQECVGWQSPDGYNGACSNSGYDGTTDNAYSASWTVASASAGDHTQMKVVFKNYAGESYASTIPEGATVDVAGEFTITFGETTRTFSFDETATATSAGVYELCPTFDSLTLAEGDEVTITGTFDVGTQSK